MVESSFPFSGTSPGDAGPYSASFFSEVMRALLGQDLYPDASVDVNSGDGTNAALNVEETAPASAQVRIREGNAFVNGYYYNNDAIPELALTIAANASGNPRIDVIALEVDFTNQEVRAIVVQGTPAGSPVAPSLTQDAAAWQVALAHVTVANGFATIVDADIDNTVREYARLLPVQEGGTGQGGGFVAGDLLVFNGVDSSAILTGGGDYRYPIGNTGESEDYVFASERRSYVRYVGSTSNDAAVTPVPIDDSDDSEGLFRAAVASNTFFPEANRVEITGLVSMAGLSGSNNTNLQAYLYDTNAAANILDVDGNEVKSSMAQLGNLTQRNVTFVPQVVIFDGTEDVEVRLRGTLTNTNFPL